MDSVRSAREVNPEAGDHWVTTDPAALEAVTEAIRTSYAAFPYWEARFGVRGRAFSASDSGWLVTIAAEEPAQAYAQVRWLAGVLAARGMPTVLLDEHLLTLADALTRHCPGDESRPEVLRLAGEQLRHRRTEVIDADRAGELAAAFDRATAHLPGAVPNCGELIVSSVCDERDEPAAVGALVQWLADPERFGAGWIAAVERTLRAAYA
ncbi:hypothetical protein [Enemella dayhoffiae]|uniref:hypothetical protein n=1 Tax=Enemella dayhoffiae TaxID=2016507 RepID=UPI001E58A02B|nr:hypothetical protein [Enemella dayhoffiae]